MTQSLPDKTGLSLRRHLVLFGLLCVVPLMLVVATVGAKIAQRERSRVEEHALLTAHEFAQRIDAELGAMKRALEVLAFSPTLQDGNYARFRDLSSAVANANSASIALREPSGQHVVNTLTPFGTQPMPITTDAVLRRADAAAVSTMAASVSDLYVGAAGRRPYVSVIVPVVRERTVASLLSMAITPERLAERMQLGPLADQGWLSSLVGSDGRIIARSRDADQFVGRSATPELLQAMSVRPTGILRSNTLDRIDVFSAYELLPSGWTVVVSVPVTVLETPVRQLAAVLALITVLVVATTAGGAWLYGRLLGAELTALAENARRIGDRRPARPSSRLISETGVVQGALEQAGAKAELLIVELDHRVKNTLAIIVSLVSRGVSDARERSTLVGRVGALAHAHEALSRQRWDGLPLKDLLRTISANQQVGLVQEGPPVVLAPKTATCLAQAVQELFSNAAIHGTGGATDIHVRWRIEDGDLILEWREPAKVPPAAPFSPRFGFTLVDLCVVRQLNGSVRVIPEQGLWTVVLRFPLQSELGRAAWTEAGA